MRFPSCQTSRNYKPDFWELDTIIQSGCKERERERQRRQRTPEQAFEEGWHSKVDGVQPSNWEQQKMQGWTYHKYKKHMLRTEVVRHSLIRKAGGDVVAPVDDRRMSQTEIDSFQSLKAEKEACMALKAVYAKQPLLRARVRHLMDGWKMTSGNDVHRALKAWAWNQTCHRKLYVKARRIRRLLPLFLQKYTESVIYAAVWNWMQRVPARVERDKEVKQFTTGFVHAVDPDNDGEFSIVELRASMGTLRKNLGGSDALFAKAAIWLLSVDKFDWFKDGTDNCTGTIRLNGLMDVMRVFLSDHWKYQGVLW